MNLLNGCTRIAIGLLMLAIAGALISCTMAEGGKRNELTNEKSS